MTGAIVGFLLWSVIFLYAITLPGKNDYPKATLMMFVFTGVGASIGYLLS